MTGTVSVDSILTMLNSLGTMEKDWLAEHLMKEVSREKKASADKRRESRESLKNRLSWKEQYQKMYDEMFAKFSADWGGSDDALKLAEELHDSRSDMRTVDVW